MSDVEKKEEIDKLAEQATRTAELAQEQIEHAQPVIDRFLASDASKVAERAAQQATRLLPPEPASSQLLGQLFSPEVVEGWKVLNERISKFYKSIEPALPQLAELATNFLSQMGNAKAFAAAGIAPSLHMDPDLMQRVREIFDSETNAGREQPAIGKAIMDVVMEAYDADDCKLVEMIVDRLTKHSEFHGREAVLSDTLSAYRQHMDSISTYPVCAMIEGVAGPFLGRVKAEGDRFSRLDHSKIAEELGQLPALTGVGLPYHDALIALVDDLYRGGDFSRPAKDIPISRHGLMHGGWVQGDRVWTLQCFFMLDLLGDIVSAFEQLLEETQLASEAEPAS